MDKADGKPRQEKWLLRFPIPERVLPRRGWWERFDGPSAQAWVFMPHGGRYQPVLDPGLWCCASPKEGDIQILGY